MTEEQKNGADGASGGAESAKTENSAQASGGAKEPKNEAKNEKQPKAPKPPKPAKVVSDKTFEHEGKVYKVLLPKMNIPEVGIRTALEVCADPEAQAALIACKCIGSVLEEVVE